MFGANNTKLFLEKEGNIMKKKLLTLLPLLAMPLALGVTGCKSSGKAVGILLPVEHQALDAARLGFEEALKAELPDVKIVYRNAGGNDADLQTFAKDLVDTCDLFLGVGTGASQALKGAEDNAGYTKPLLFTAVTDPVDAELVASKDNPTGFVCGTTDANPVEEQIALIKEFNPAAAKLGIMYTQKETNSKVQADQAKAAAEAAGMTATIQTCTGPSDIQHVASALVDSAIDALYIPTDNNIAANMNAIKEAAASRHVLVVCGEENMLKQGGHITLSIDYKALGISTGKMAAQILKGEKAPTDFPVVPVPASDCTYAYSSVNLESANLEMPEALLNAHEWVNIIPE